MSKKQSKRKVPYNTFKNEVMKWEDLTGMYKKVGGLLLTTVAAINYAIEASTKSDDNEVEKRKKELVDNITRTVNESTKALQSIKERLEGKEGAIDVTTEDLSVYATIFEQLSNVSGNIIEEIAPLSKEFTVLGVVDDDSANEVSKIESVDTDTVVETNSNERMKSE